MTEGKNLQTAAFMLGVDGFAADIQNVHGVNITASFQGVTNSKATFISTVDLRKTDNGHF
jgi:hypothetical protein